jgi:hypothetical protein
MVDNDIVQTLLKFARPTPSLSRSEARELDHMAEVIKLVGQDCRKRLIADAVGQPCLQSCSADGTPVQVSEQAAAALPSGRLVRRYGKAAHEFLVMSEFVRRSLADGSVPTTFVVTDPIPLTHGKAVDRIVEASRCRWPSLRQMGHRGGAIQHYCWDRAGFSKLERRMRQWHELMLPTFVAETPREQAIMDASEWIVFTACACHDLQNAFKWSMPQAFADADMIRDCFIGVAAIRNSFDIVLTYLGEWVAASVTPGVPFTVVDKKHWEHVWNNLGVPDDVIQLLVHGLELRVDGKVLQVSAAELGKGDCVSLVIKTLLAVWGIKRFSDSRWLTVGPCARALVASRLTGLSSFFEWVQRKPSVSGYYLNGYWRLQNPHWEFFVKAAIISTVPDACLRMVLKDNRVVLHYDRLWEAMTAAMERVVAIPMSAWDSLALCSGASGQSLRAECFHACHRSIAFARYRIFAPAKALPWSLCRGNIAENLDRLGAGPRPDEDIAAKIWDLLDLGINRHLLHRMVLLLADCPWSTAVAEQLHASVALISRHHPEYGLGSVLARSTVLTARKLLPGATEAEKIAAKAEDRLRRLRNKNPDKATGRQFLFRDLSAVAGSRRAATPAAGRKVLQQKILKATSKMQKTQPAAMRLAYNLRARAMVGRRREELADQVAECLAELTRARAKVAEERGARKPLLLATAQWTPVDVEALAARSKDPALTSMAVARRRDAACQAPATMSNALLKALDDQDIPEPSAPPRPAWMQAICWQRESLEGCVFVVHRPAGREYWLFVLGIQTPGFASFTQLSLLENPYPALDFPSDWEDRAAMWYRLRWTVNWRDCNDLSGLAAVPEDDVAVLDNVVYMGENVYATDSYEERLSVVLSRLPRNVKHPEATEDGAPKQTRRGGNSAASSEEPPWAAKLWTGKAPRDPCPVAAPAAGSDTDSLSEVDPDTLAQEAETAWGELDAFRSRLWELGEGEEYNFKVRVLGGSWTMMHRGVAADAIQGHARGQEVQAWCRAQKLPLSARFEIRAYGEASAAVFARAWCSKMQHLYRRGSGGEAASSSSSADLSAVWKEPSEFTMLMGSLGSTSRAKTRGQAIRNLSLSAS